MNTILTTNITQSTRFEQIRRNVELIGSPISQTVGFELISPLGGSIYSPQGHAHLAEHLMFTKGNRYDRYAVTKLFEGIGSRNGYTTYDRVGYVFESLVETFNEAMDIYDDILCSANFFEHELEKELQIVRAEIEQHQGNVLSWKMNTAISNALRVQGIIELPPHIDASALQKAHQETLAQFRIRVTCPLTAFDPVRTRLESSPLVNMGTNWTSSDKHSELPGFTEEPLPMKASTEGSCSFVFGHFPWYTSQEINQRNLVPDILLDMLRNQMFKELREKRTLCYNPSIGGINVWRGFNTPWSGMLVIVDSANTKDPKHLQRCTEELHKVIADFSSNGLDQDAWLRARNKLLFKYTRKSYEPIPIEETLFDLNTDRPTLYGDLLEPLAKLSLQNARNEYEAFCNLLKNPHSIEGIA